VPVIAGAGSNNTQVALELARAAERAGASALLAIAPFYLKPSQAGIVAHFRSMHDAVNIPVILYDMPARTGLALDDVTIKRLAELPRIIGLKDAAGDLARLVRLRRRLGPEFLLLSGDGSSQVAYRMAGGDGCISSAANIAPALHVALHRACDERLDGDANWHEQLLAPLNEILSLEADPIAAKRALCRMGLMGDGMRLPMTPLSPEFDRKLQRVLDAVLPVEDKEARRLAAERARGASPSQSGRVALRRASAMSTCQRTDREAEAEPPSASVSDDGASGALADRVLAIAHVSDAAHVAVIGHHTLPFILALLRRGCGRARSLRPDAPSPDCEPADLAWIVDVEDERELDDALRAARRRTGTKGRVVLEGATGRWRSALATIRDRALAAGLDIVSFDHMAQRLVFAPAA
jgi:4-hydroxy-tetrahydrodipicolinate synthase